MAGKPFFLFLILFSAAAMVRRAPSLLNTMVKPESWTGSATTHVSPPNVKT